MAGPLRMLGRDRVTNVVGAAFVLIGSTNAALGPVSDELRRSWHLSGAVTGLHGALFGWFLLVFALASARVLRAADGAALLRVSVVVMGVGLVVLASGRNVAVTLLGAAMAGIGGAVTVLVSPQIVSARHGEHDRAVAFTYINGLSQLGSVGAPLLLALSLRQHWGWRWPLAAIGVVGGALVAQAAWRTDLPHPLVGESGRAGALSHLRASPGVRVRWLVLTLGISMEFGTLFWAAATVRELAGGSSAAGAVGVGLFAGGMALGRMVGPRLVARVDNVRLLRVSFVVAGAGAVILRVGPGVAVRLAALAMMGLGLALVYPVAFSRLYGVGVPDADVGAVGALASGTAVTIGPLALGALADASNLRWALLILPGLALAGLVALTQAGEARPPVLDPD